MRGTFICEAIVKTSMIPVPGQALEPAPSDTEGTGGMRLSPAPYEAFWRDEEQPLTTPDAMAEPVNTQRTGVSPARSGGAGGSFLWLAMLLVSLLAAGMVSQTGVEEQQQDKASSGGPD